MIAVILFAVPVWWLPVPVAMPTPRPTAPMLQPPARPLEPDWPRVLTRRV